MQRVNSLLSAGVTLTSTGTAVASPIPRDSSGYFPEFVRVVATGAGCYVKVGNIGVTAVAGDCMIQPLDGEILCVAGCKAISALTVSGTSSITVVPLERGSWSYDLKTLDYAFTSMTSLPSQITFARADATTCATYFGSDGLLKTAAANVPRFDYDPVTLAAKGLLIEEGRANLLLQSRDMTTASWTKTDVTPARTQVGLDGAANSACLMTAGVAGTSKTSQTSAAYTANSTVTISGVFKYGNCPWIMVTTNATGNGGRAWFNIQTGVKGTTVALGTGTSLTSSIISLGGGWYRCVFSCLPDATSTTAIFELYDVAGDGSTARVNNSTYIVDYAQLEVGAFATSPIPTTTAAVTRAADSASMTGTNFSSWYSQSAGTFVVEFSQPAATTDISRRLFAVNDGTAANQIQLSVAQTGQVQAITYVASVSSFTPTAAGAISANTVVKASLSLESPTKSLSRDGAAVQTASVAFPTSGMTQMLIGSQIGSNYACAHIRRLSFYAARLPNATLQSLTA